MNPLDEGLHKIGEELARALVHELTALGIAVSQLALLLPHQPVLRMVLGLFVAMMAASSFGLGPVVPIQAGVSVLLVLTLGPETARIFGCSTFSLAPLAVPSKRQAGHGPSKATDQPRIPFSPTTMEPAEFCRLILLL
jgi:hypothetical protein